MTPYYSIVIGVALSLILCVMFTILVRYSCNRQRARCRSLLPLPLSRAAARSAARCCQQAASGVSVLAQLTCLCSSDA